MGFNCGIVGLPNVGKSTLFNALTENTNAAAENYPFCTIEPNMEELQLMIKELVNFLNLITLNKLLLPL